MGEARVVRPGEGEDRPLRQPRATGEVRIGPETGSDQLRQSVYWLDSRAHASVGHATADEVLYVIDGTADLRSNMGNDRCELQRGIAALIPAVANAMIT